MSKFKNRKTCFQYDGTITKDNIHLYYEFMSDEDLEKYGYILNDIFEDRERLINKFLNLDDDLIDLIDIDYYSHFQIIGLSVCSIKDTLKPIAEYIAEIKKSSKYV